MRIIPSIWRTPRISSEQRELQERADKTLEKLDEIDRKSTRSLLLHRIVQQENHFTQRIYGELI